MLTIKRLLIANRSEIAVRIIQTCKSLGIETIAVFAPEDATSPYVYLADKAIALTQSGIASYLNAQELISIALQENCDAIHPGYGFLSEKEHFAAQTIAAGLTWVGPRPEVISMAGDKTKARTLAQQLQVPITPGKHFVITEQDLAIAFAISIGFPVMLKCPHGGGGKAMRIAKKQEQFIDCWQAVVREGAHLFLSDEVIVEKYLENARHIEIQIAGDGKTAIHLFERDCSTQRRNQKIIEEAPSLIASTVKEKLYKESLKLATALSYDSVGTVEFLVTDKQIYFLEINTRLQVEHGVTELITGIDLVWLQLFIASHKLLPITQKEVQTRGHAIQARLYSEDPSNEFMPSTGTISFVQFPNHPMVRIDHSLESNTEIHPFFDPMIAKIIGFGLTRELARKNLITALAQTMLFGVTTNIEFLQSILQSSFFIQGDVTTTLLSKDVVKKLCKEINTIENNSISPELLEYLFALQPPTPFQATVTKNQWKAKQWK